MQVLKIAADSAALHYDPYSSDDRRWEAVCARDRAADGHFLFAVSTTGIFCRPSCPAKRARRENVSFFEGADAAISAGYRPCRRCKPADGTAGRHAELVAAACRVIDEAEETPSLEEIGGAVGISPFHLHRIFKRVTGLTPRGYAAARKAERVKDSLAGGQSVTAAIYAAGYGSSSRFYETAHSRLGMKPKTYASGGTHERIRFALAHSSLGDVIVAATDAGICDLRFGDDPEELVGEVRARFHEADLVEGDAGFQTIIQTIVAHIENPGAEATTLPLDVRGTLFQQRVWEALRDIEPGETLSYAEVAEKIGQPTATRAVAQACAANRIAVLIPCHRVVKSDRTTGGYRWGAARKQLLLDREATAGVGKGGSAGASA
jgi:AraC family transcriptional regulator of adaptative response/methylated-DNA-[protein]-cysteine methyltransferase